MRQIKYITMATAAVILLAACEVRDPIYDTVHPEQGTITLTTDWSQRGEGISIPGSYTAQVGEYSEYLTGITNTVDHLFAPGNHTVYAYNTADGIAMSGTMATADYTAGVPGWLFAGKQDVEITKDADHEITVLMRQQVRQLTLVIEPTGGLTENIESITGTLSGVAGTLDVDDDTHGSPSDVALTFTKGTDGKWTATVRLLGIADVEQRLTGTVTFTDGTPGDIAIDSDLSDELTGFNADKKTPMTLSAQIVDTPTSAGFTATISEWSVVQGGNVIAD